MQILDNILSVFISSNTPWLLLKATDGNFFIEGGNEAFWFNINAKTKSKGVSLKKAFEYSLLAPNLDEITSQLTTALEIAEEQNLKLNIDKSDIEGLKVVPIIDSEKFVLLSLVGQKVHENSYLSREVLSKDKQLIEKILEQTEKMGRIGGWSVDLESMKVTQTEMVSIIHEVDPNYEPDLETGINFYKEGESRDLITQVMDVLISEGKPFDVEVVVVTAKGNERWVRVTGKAEMHNGKARRVFGSFQDIHERKKAEFELRNAKNKFESIITTLDGIFWEARLHNFELSYMSPQVEKILGFTVEECINDRNFWVNQIHPEDRDRVIKIAKDKTEAGEDYVIEYRMIAKNGKVVWLKDIVSLIKENGNPTLLRGLLIDISARKSIESERELAIFQLKERVKEQSCLYQVLHVCNTETEIDALFKKILSIIPNGFQFPEQVYVRIDFGDKNFKTSNYSNNDWSIYSERDLGNEKLRLLVGYNSLNPGQETEVFISEEQILLDALTENIGLKILQILSNKVVLDNKERLQAILDNEPECVKVVDINGILLEMNPAGLGIIEAPDLETVRGQKIQNVIHPDDLDVFMDLHKNALKGKRDTARFRIIGLKGTNRWMESSSAPLHDGAGKTKAVLSVTRDISARIQAELSADFEKRNKEALINNTDDLIWSVDRNFCLIAANQAFLDSLKKSTKLDFKRGDSLMMYDKFPTQFLDYWKQLYSRGLDGVSFKEVIFSPRFKSQHETWSEVSFNPIMNGDVISGVACYSRDITQNKIYEDDFKKRTFFIETTLKNLSIGIAMNLISTGEATFLNQKFIDIYGWPEEDLSDISTFFEKVYPDPNYRKVISERIIADIESGDPTRMNWEGIEITTSKGEKRIVNARNIPIYDQDLMISTVFDVTEQYKAQSDLRQSNQRYEYVIQATSDAIWDYDLKSGDLHWGDGFKTLFGFEFNNPKENYTQWEKSIHPDDYERAANAVNVVLGSGESIWSQEYRFKRANGEYAFVLDKGIVLRNEKGKPVRIIGAIQDVTEQKRTEILLRNLNETLQKRAEELKASNLELERFAYVASHDLQEPLRMVTSFLQLLEQRNRDLLDESSKTFLHYAVDGAERMKRLILDLLEFSRLGSNTEEKKLIDLNAVVENVKIALGKAIEESNAQIQIEPLPQVRGIESQLFQLFQNLIGNAIKYRSTSEPQIKISVSDENKHWKFGVSDNGIGINPKYFEKIFVIFQRLHNKDEYSGTGIGLAIAKKIIERHNGQIWVEPNKESGSVFFFTIEK
jgi:PAS domain S-box-containing protein